MFFLDLPQELKEFGLGRRDRDVFLDDHGKMVKKVVKILST
jgi:hypothetical protein